MQNNQPVGNGPFTCKRGLRTGKPIWLARWRAPIANKPLTYNIDADVATIIPTEPEEPAAASWAAPRFD